MDALHQSLSPILIQLEPITTAFVSTTEKLEYDLLTWMGVGWHPTYGFDADGRSVFDPAIDIERMATRQFPFGTLTSCLAALCVFLFISFCGLILLKCCGGNRHRDPFIPKSLLYGLKFVYNVVQIYLCSYLTLEAGILAHRNGYSWFPFTRCNEFNFERPVMDNLIWLYYMSKMLDWCDTVFIILGNKPRQFTFLHIYHHSSVWFMNWLNLATNYDAEVFVAVAFNAWIHVIMYTYYLISMHMPQDRDSKGRAKYSVWWKRHLTSLQMTQFFGMNLHGILILYNGCSQIVPRGTALYLGYIMTLFILFLNFFLRQYCGGTKKGKASKRKKRQ